MILYNVDKRIVIKKPSLSLWMKESSRLVWICRALTCTRVNGIFFDSKWPAVSENEKITPIMMRRGPGSWLAVYGPLLALASRIGMVYGISTS